MRRGGLLAAWLGIAPGPMIVIVLGAAFVLSYLLSPKYGLLAKR